MIRTLLRLNIVSISAIKPKHLHFKEELCVCSGVSCQTHKCSTLNVILFELEHFNIMTCEVFTLSMKSLIQSIIE